MVGRRRKRTEDVANWAKKLRTKSRVKSFSVIAKLSNIIILFQQRLLVKGARYLFPCLRIESSETKSPPSCEHQKKGGLLFNEKQC
jgi:hypothetical protein